MVFTIPKFFVERGDLNVVCVRLLVCRQGGKILCLFIQTRKFIYRSNNAKYECVHAKDEILQEFVLFL